MSMVLFQWCPGKCFKCMRKYWNTHYIRQSCHKTVAGVPDTLYFLPENSGGTDCLILLPQEEIDDMKLECQDAEDENVP